MTELSSATLFPLPHWGTLIASGADARAYLQGQLSFDLDRLTPKRVELATCNSAQGRVQAILWLVERGDEVVMLLPAAMVDRTLARLKKYVMRAKVSLTPGADRFTVLGAANLSADDAPRTHRRIDGRSYIRWPGTPSRWLCIAQSNLVVPSQSEFAEKWRHADIEAGLPQVYPQTHEAFVAQMLNIDVLEGIGFEKGCYIGQEIIARTHYRGAIKRRMFRFRSECAPPEPGIRILAGDQHAGDVVDAVNTPNGCELLAVVTLTQADAPLALDIPERPMLERCALPYSIA